jgi:hypothetical protein
MKRSDAVRKRDSDSNEKACQRYDPVDRLFGFRKHEIS